MNASKEKLSKDYLGVIFGTSFTNEQVEIIKDRSRRIDERKNSLFEMLTEKQKIVLTEFRKMNNSDINEYSFLNNSLLDEFDYQYIIDQIVI